MSERDVGEFPPGMSLKDLRIYLGADGKPAAQADALLEAHGVREPHAREDTLVPIDVCWRIFTEHARLIEDEMHCVFGTRLKRSCPGWWCNSDELITAISGGAGLVRRPGWAG